MPLTCPHCHDENPRNAEYCRTCGAFLREDVPPPTNAHGVPDEDIYKDLDPFGVSKDGIYPRPIVITLLSVCCFLLALLYLGAFGKSVLDLMLSRDSFSATLDLGNPEILFTVFSDTAWSLIFLIWFTMIGYGMWQMRMWTTIPMYLFIILNAFMASVSLLDWGVFLRFYNPVLVSRAWLMENALYHLIGTGIVGAIFFAFADEFHT